MKKIKYQQIVTRKLRQGAIIRTGFVGFKEDYLGIHCLIRKYLPLTFGEIGTSSGAGTNIICNAMGISRYFFWKNKGKKVYSIDVPPGTDPKKIYPGAEDGHPQKAGALCRFPYTQIFGDSTKFDFSPYYPIEAWFIDGKHDFKYAKKDTDQALKSNPSLIIWHDKQIDGVTEGILEAMKEQNQYQLFDLEHTRLIFAVRKDLLGKGANND